MPIMLEKNWEVDEIPMLLKELSCQPLDLCLILENRRATSRTLIGQFAGSPERSNVWSYS
jgi:hypothetical protein